MTLAIFFVAAYFLGSIPTGYWMGLALKGIDIRKHGSGNVGATIVVRVLGKGPGVITFFLDLFKGLIPVVVAQHLFSGQPNVALGAGLLAIVGHVTSPLVGWKGGKGVATSTGVFIALLPWSTLIAFTVFLIALFASGYVSVGSIAAAVALVVASFLTHTSLTLKALALVVSSLIIWMHRGNIQRLRQGTESGVLWRKKL